MQATTQSAPPAEGNIQAIHPKKGPLAMHLKKGHHRGIGRAIELPIEFYSIYCYSYSYISNQYRSFFILKL